MDTKAKQENQQLRRSNVQQEEMKINVSDY